MVSNWSALTFLAFVASPAPPAVDVPASTAAAMRGEIQQLRIYELEPGNARAFEDRFRDHALRLMRRHGFGVVRAWESRTGSAVEFVYLLSWPDEAVMRRAWSAFLADAEWIEIKRRTGSARGRFVRSIQDRTLEELPFSPGRAPAGASRASRE